MPWPPTEWPWTNDSPAGAGNGTQIKKDHIADVVTELGTGTGVNAPKGTDASVQARLARIDAALLAMGGGAGNPYEITVVSVDMASNIEAQGTSTGPYVFVCDGTNDEVQINLAIDAAAALFSRNASLSVAGSLQMAKVQLTGGRFTLSAGIYMRSGVHLAGMGQLTELISSANGAPGMINLKNANDHVTCVSDLWINCANSGTCNGISYNMDGSGNGDPNGVAGYPTSSPDAQHVIRDVRIMNTTSGRHGIYFDGGSGGNFRGYMIHNIQMNRIGGKGIWLNGSSDGFLSNMHVGTCTQEGFYIDAANTKMANNKAFYCNEAGLKIISGNNCCTVAGFESQDNYTGYNIAGSWHSLSGISVDNARDDGLLMSGHGNSVAGLNVYRVSSERHGTWGAMSGRGVQVTGVGNSVQGQCQSTLTCTVTGSNSWARITRTTTISGTPAAAALYSVGT